MEKIWGFIVYALQCAMNVLLSMAGKANFTDNWMIEGLIGIVTILIIMFVFYWLFRIIGLLVISK
jgi:preprotein translocase subunit SecD